MSINDTVNLFARLKGDDQVLSVSTRYGVVDVARLELGEVQGLDYVEVWLHGQEEEGEPHYKIFNPPVYVVDEIDGEEVEEKVKENDIEMRVTAKLRYDPVMALIETVARHGGIRT